MSLDALYGPGTTAAFATKVDISAVIPGATGQITQTNAKDGSVRAETIWRTAKGLQIGIYRLDYYPKHVHCVFLEIEPAFRGKGILLHIMKELEPWWPTLGLLRNTMSVIPNSLGEKALRTAGFRELPNGEWGTPLPATRCREFLNWVAAGKLPAAEPVWRKELGVQVDVF